jgi:hypothetical protein
LARVATFSDRPPSWGGNASEIKSTRLAFAQGSGFNGLSLAGRT